GSISKSFNAAIANPARSCPRPRCWPAIRTPAMLISTRRCLVTFAAAAPTSVFAPLSNKRHRLHDFQPFWELMMGLEERPHEGPIREVPRRAFLRAGLAFGGGLLLGFSVSASGRGAPTTSNSTTAAFEPNAFIRIGH